MAYTVPVRDTSSAPDARAEAMRLAKDELLNKIRADGVQLTDAEFQDLRMWEQWDENDRRTLWVEWP
ncbi:MAG: hypothetical protein M3017_03775 [Actinomycetota bacterium]|nr:hypothetical protein [Actinomycetota bacterium]